MVVQTGFTTHYNVEVLSGLSILIGSWEIQLGRDLRRPVVQPLPQCRVSCEIRTGYTGFHRVSSPFINENNDKYTNTL